ncbi:MAG TPA: SipW-dependent-type signal peptide-containing protein [Anaerolineae bacterium]|nr:SipW-dependent-type signal peptide-containing protein [Anaerolineae bacterium]HOR00515.1 SipW-dependent-type signal peptide-containing protein [Anaerolineae bacterium]HPL28597.1 SipW-dependent-type signal peptide-containing protein [Anaerolineae bacterium]
MRRCLFFAAILVLLAVLAFGAGGSGAWFTDQDTLEGLSVSTGRLAVALSGPSFGIGDVEPGEVCGGHDVVFSNLASPASTLPVKYRLRAEKTDGSDELYDHLLVKVNWKAQSTDPLWTKRYIGPLKTMLISGYPDMANVAPGSSQYWEFIYSVASDTPDSAQGESCTFSIIAEATQVSNPGWGE